MTIFKYKLLKNKKIIISLIKILKLSRKFKFTLPCSSKSPKEYREKITFC